MLLEREHLLDSTDKRLSILVLCTGNSARSIMAEALFNSIGSPLFQACSAGSNPTGYVNPLALEKIATLGPLQSDYRSKSWSEFSEPQALSFDVVLTVCDNAAAETCPPFSGNCQHIHWGLPDPAAITGDQYAAREAFTDCFNELKQRVSHLAASCSVKPDVTFMLTLMKLLGEHSGRIDVAMSTRN